MSGVRKLGAPRTFDERVLAMVDVDGQLASEAVLARVRRGEAVSDEELARALGLDPRGRPRLPLWERALRGYPRRRREDDGC